MITCVLEYRIDRAREAEFEQWCRMWLRLLPKFGAIHHGYFLPSEGRSDVALGLFSFPSLGAYERYRCAAAVDVEVIAATRFRDGNAGVLSWNRTFFRPVLPADDCQRPPEPVDK
ncbi:NIPSNAP family protein [Sphingomonas sp.]|uniref:NIPSNAP family protein n=1 Tax=Sphingomonas sp. TaxID=28214 RepID=UPI0038A1DA03